MNASELQTCDVCGKELSKRAEFCPHCGDPKYRGSPAEGCFRGVMTLIFLGIVFWAVFSALFRGCMGGG